MSAVVGLPDLGRARVMGVVNVTPDSFSDGGCHSTAAAAIDHGEALLAAGADIIDIGGESTRPGAARVPLADELARVVPVVEALAAAGATVSIDTTRATVARAALDAGAMIVNDVSGGAADAGVPALVAARGCPYVVMHSRGDSSNMVNRTDYGGDVVAGVRRELADRVAAVLAAGVDAGQLIIDPGIGFAKTAAQNWELLRALPELGVHGRPLLVGASRKTFLGRLLADAAGRPRPVGRRDDASQAVTALAAAAGAWCVRVHDVGPAIDAVRVAAAWTGTAVGQPAPAPLARTPPVTDTIALTGLRVRGRHGVLAVERAEGQDFVVDVELSLDLRAAAASDALTDTVDYGGLAQRLAAIVSGEPVDLIETLAQRLADASLADDRVTAVVVTVHKPSAPIPLAFDDVAVTVRRARSA